MDRLVGGAVDYLIRHGGSEENLTIVRVPGAFEMPLACKKLAASGKYDGIVAVGAVIRGGTPHFDFVAAEATKGRAEVGLLAHGRLARQTQRTLSPLLSPPGRRP